MDAVDNRPLSWSRTLRKTPAEYSTRTPLSDRIRLRRLELEIAAAGAASKLEDAEISSRAATPLSLQPLQTVNCRSALLLSHTEVPHERRPDDDSARPCFGWTPLICPLSGERLRYPVRGRRCRHFACFDRDAFRTALVKNNRAPVPCPLCGVPTLFSDLVSDDDMAEVLVTVGAETVFVGRAQENGRLATLTATDISGRQSSPTVISRSSSRRDVKSDNCNSDLALALHLCEEAEARAWTAERLAADAVRKGQVAAEEVADLRRIFRSGGDIVTDWNERQNRVEVLEGRLRDVELYSAKLSDKLLLAGVDLETARADLRRHRLAYEAMELRLMEGRLVFNGPAPAVIAVPVGCAPAVDQSQGSVVEGGRLRALVAKRVEEMGLLP